MVKILVYGKITFGATGATLDYSKGIYYDISVVNEGDNFQLPDLTLDNVVFTIDDTKRTWTDNQETGQSDLTDIIEHGIIRNKDIHDGSLLDDIKEAVMPFDPSKPDELYLDSSKLFRKQIALHEQEQIGEFHQKGKSYRYSKDNQKILLDKQLMAITNNNFFGGDHVVLSTETNTTSSGDQELTIIIPKENQGAWLDDYNVNKYKLKIFGNPKTDLANSKMSYFDISFGKHAPIVDFMSKNENIYKKDTSHTIQITDQHTKPHLLKVQSYNGDSGLFEIDIDFEFWGTDPSDMMFKSTGQLTYNWKGDIDASRKKWIETFRTNTFIKSVDLTNSDGNIEMKITIPSCIKDTHLKVLHKIPQGL